MNNKYCIFTKADKGNEIVIMDKDDYVIKRQSTIENEWKNLIYRLRIPNPKDPSVYFHSKIHKLGNKMKPIPSAIY